ncbi:MAG: SRPBCC domain-containing protein [Flavobacterium sp.]|nr:SRPBCC domain-containing protein [Flavobacterium sp.]
MKKFIVKKKIEIKANPEEVWDALTNPEKTKKYFFKCKVHSNWKKGSAITFKGKIFLIINFEMSGVILDIAPLKLLKYNIKNSGTSSISIITDKLIFENGITTLTINDDVGQDDGAEKRYKKSNKGWDKILKGLKELVEEQNNHH